MRQYVYPTFLSVLLLYSSLYASQDKKLQRIIFDEQRIEGKIRRPQLVLIKAEQRPEFVPMVMQSVGTNSNITEFVDESVIEKSPYSGAFTISGDKITNLSP